MSTLSEEPTEKHQRDSTDEPLNKRRRSQSSDEPVEITNITDVNDNCLEHIFKKLSLSDLLNVADSCKRFQNAARLVFSSNYGKHLMHFGNVCPAFGCGSNISSCLKIMRCFGASIEKLDIRFVHVSEDIQNELDRYLNEYCAETVVELEYGGRTLINLTKSFTEVESVNFSNGLFRCEPTNINRLFPNLRVLTMRNYNMVQYAMINIPHLELLDVCVAGVDRDKLESVLKRNRQLQRLRIQGAYLDLNFLRFLSKCTQLESLRLIGGGCLTFNAITVPIHFESVRNFKVSGSYLQSLDAANISISFEQLDELKIHSEWNDNVINFIKHHPSISTLNCEVDRYFWRIDEENVVKSMPSVTKLSCRLWKLSAEYVIDIVGECHLLKYFEFQLTQPTEYNILKESLGAEWTSSIDQDRVVKLQR